MGLNWHRFEILHALLPVFFRCVVNSTLGRMLLGHTLQKSNYPYYFYFNNLLTFGYYILSVKNNDKVQQERFLKFNYILFSYILPVVYSVLKSAHFLHGNT